MKSAVFVMIMFFVLPLTAFAQLPTQEVSIIAKKFDFYPNQIVVRKGQPLKFYLTSIDATHGLSLPDFKVNVQIPPAQITTVNFTPDKTGEYIFRCSVFCGLGHLGMKGKLIVVE